MNELPINEYICAIKRPMFHSEALIFYNFMISKSQNSLDLHIS